MCLATVQKTGVFEHIPLDANSEHGQVFNNPVQLSFPFNKHVKGLLNAFGLASAGLLIGASSPPIIGQAVPRGGMEWKSRAARAAHS